MHNHSSGGIQGTRFGGTPVIHTFPMFYTDATGVAKKLCTIPASVASPAMFRVTAMVATVNDSGTTATLSVGVTGAGYTDILSAKDLTAAAGVTYAPAGTATTKLVTADTDLYALPTYTGTASTAGLAYVMVEVFAVNVNETTTSGN